MSYSSSGRQNSSEVSSHRDIYQKLQAQAQKTPDAIAIAAPERLPLTYRRMLAQIDSVISQLNRLGVGCHDRVAIALPNGPEMAVAFLAIASAATCAPLNPAYRHSEFDFYLSDLKAKALIVQSGVADPAKIVAKERGIGIIELAPVLTAEAGIFTLSGGEVQCPAYGALTQSEDVALVLHTSGTTSRPKIVPLTHANLCTSADNIQLALQLSQSDRALNMMPLFHIHGLVGVLLSSLSAGASVVCTPGFDATRFFEWMSALRPTWYSAVPTMHQAILALVEANRRTIKHCPIRFIRSSSAALPHQVMSALEREFNAPVIEAYGMTEASHQIASNPLPPKKRKVGSVGIAAGPEVAIMDSVGNLLDNNEVGEIVIRGANVTSGYENNPQANNSAFTNGWFRTGDQGYLDSDDYLFITARLKEIINRGGEKISPREIDEVLLDFPAVAQAVSFAVPHPTLGEDIAAAVVLLQNASVTEREIREFAARRLADFKVPVQVVFVDKIPTGPTGKLQRIGLAQKLESLLRPPFVASRTEVEKVLCEIWADVLGVQQLGIYDNFFMLGGDSLKAIQVISLLKAIFQVDLTLPKFVEAPTVIGLSQILAEHQVEADSLESLTQILSQIEELSEEDVQRLLAQEVG